MRSERLDIKDRENGLCHDMTTIDKKIEQNQELLYKIE